MARITLEDIIRRAHQAADVPLDSTSRTDAVIGKAEAVDVANDGLAELHDILVGVYEDWLTTKTDLTTVASTETILLPDDFYKVRQLFMIDSGQRVELDSWSLSDATGTTRTETSDRPRWRAMNSHMYFNPLPAAAYTLELWYVRQFRRLEDEKDEISPELPTGWEAYPIAYMAAYILSKEERDPQVALLRMERVKARIQSAARNRGTTGPMAVKKSTGRFSDKKKFPTPRA